MVCLISNYSCMYRMLNFQLLSSWLSILGLFKNVYDFKIDFLHVVFESTGTGTIETKFRPKYSQKYNNIMDRPTKISPITICAVKNQYCCACQFPEYYPEIVLQVYSIYCLCSGHALFSVILTLFHWAFLGIPKQLRAQTCFRLCLSERNSQPGGGGGVEMEICPTSGVSCTPR